CPTFHRGCYGCFGPVDDPNTASMADALAGLGVAAADIDRLFHTFNSWAPPYRDLAVPVDPPTRRRS
ncbi:MAG: hypothetical protein ACR2P0_15395, partial [Acidimicrobiales bacterium]